VTSDVFRYPVVELHAGDDWHEITEDVRYRGGITITRGRGDEDDAAPPQTCRLTLDDRNGDYNPRNPVGRWYGSIGRNTPVRVALMLASSEFGTPVASGSWGSTDAVDGQTVYSWTNTGGTAASHAVAGGAATHALAAAGDIRTAELRAVDLSDVEARVTVTVPTSNVTGTGAIGAANLMLHGQTSPSTAYYMLRLLIQPDESVTVNFHYTTGSGTTALSTDDTIPGLVHTAAQPLRVAFAIEGRTLRAKVWPANSPEPYGWHKTYVDEDTSGARPLVTGQPGFVGVRSSLVAGNTNGPITLSYTDFEVRHPRFSGEVSVWPPTRDITGTDKTVTVTAAGPRRRGTQGASALGSPLRRQLSGDVGTSGAAAWAYWPLEDQFRQVAGEVVALAGDGDLAFQPPTVGTTAGRISWAADTGLPGSAALPTLTGGGSLVGNLSPATPDDAWSITWAEKMNASDGAFCLFATSLDYIQIVAQVDPSVSATTLNVYLTVSSLGISAFMMSHTFASKEDVETWHHYGLRAVQSGTSVQFTLYVDGVSVGSYTRASLTLNGLAYVQLSSVTNAQNLVGIGHVAVYYAAPDMGDIAEAFRGNTSETAGQRMQRLCGEEAVEFDWIGTIESGTYPPSANAHTAAVGAQSASTLVALLDESAEVDRGLLFEQRGIVGYHYRTRTTLYSQDPAVTLDYAAGHIAPDWRPVDDDRYTRNDITAQRTGGGTYRHEVTEGRLSTADIADGGAGRYRESVTVNVQADAQLAGLAEWIAHLGTVDEPRYPTVTVELHGHGLRGDAVRQAALLDLDLGDRVVIENVDDVADDVDQLVIGYTEHLTEYVHALVLVCAPASPYRVVVLDSADARLDSDSSTLTAGITDTATSWQVSTSDPLDLWTTSGSDFPLDVMIGGERITLSAITGATSPQTFTASARSVNGIVKSHQAAAGVHVAQPVYLGL
jgi:hypothetical protein